MTVQADITFSLDGCGWGERYYLSPDSEDLYAVAGLLANARVKLLAAPAVLKEIRIFDLDRPLLPTVRQFYFGGAFQALNPSPPLGDFRYPAGFSWDCFLMCFRTEKGGRRTLWLNGVPSDALKNGELIHNFIFVYEMVKQLRRFRDALLSPKLRLQIEELLPDADAPSSAIDAIDVAASGLYRIHTRADFPADDNPQVRVMGSRGTNLGRARGIRRIVQAEGPRTVVIDRGPLPEGGPIRYGGGAVLRAAVYTWSPALFVPYGPMRLDPVPNTGITFIPPQLRITNPLKGEFGIGVRPRGGVQPRRRGRKRSARD